MKRKNLQLNQQAFKQIRKEIQGILWDFIDLKDHTDMEDLILDALAFYAQSKIEDVHCIVPWPVIYDIERCGELKFDEPKE